MDRAQTTAAGPAACGADDVRALLVGETGADRRFEDWIADRLGGGPDRPAPVSWPGRVEVESAGQARRARPKASASPGPQQGWRRIRVEQRGEVTVAHVLDSQLLGEGPLAELRAELRGLAAAGCARVVLSVANVERISSQFLEILATLDRHCSRAPGGRLKLCKVGPEVARILELSGLDRRFEVVPDLGAALGGPWPSGPRRVPVEILGELARRPDREADDERPPSGPIGFDEPDPALGPAPASLVVRREGKRLGTMPIPPEGIRIGRESPCEIRAKNRAVSRVHAWIGEREGRFVLEDLGSTNGTTIDRRVVRSATIPLRPGSSFGIGPYHFEFSDAAAPIADELVSEWTAEADRPDQEMATAPPPPDDRDPDVVPFESEAGDPAPLRVESVEGVLVLSPIVSRLDDAATLDAIRDQLDELLRRPGPSKRVVLNLAPLVGLSGRAIGVILAHQLRLQRVGGSLRLAQATASVATALEVVGLPSLIESFAMLDEAILSRWPD